MSKVFYPKIGLEIHVELKTASKMFCSSVNNPDETIPNKNICPVCMGHPGTLPVPNKKAIELTLKTGLALNCEIPEISQFDRKNYFYPDLPKGYQISQYKNPFCGPGFLDIDMGGGSWKKVRFERIHLEEDVGKLIHHKDYSLVDFNRAGIPLMEMVTMPDLESGEEARKFLQELQLLLRYLGVSDADMEKGHMRMDVNVSISSDPKKLGEKVELKNINSFRAAERAINHEIARQEKILTGGEKIKQETRGWDDKPGTSHSQRTKEEAHDYRYMPEPDIPMIKIQNPKSLPVRQAGKIQNDDAIDISLIGNSLPELPRERRERFAREYNLPPADIEILTVNKELGGYFEKVASELGAWLVAEGIVQGDKLVDSQEYPRLIKLAANYLITKLSGLLASAKVVFDTEKIKITPENFAEFILLVYQGKISSAAAGEILALMLDRGGDPSRIMEESGLNQVFDETLIGEAVDKAIAANSQAVQDYQGGKLNALQFLVGRVMRETKGKTNPKTVEKIIKEKLKP